MPSYPEVIVRFAYVLVVLLTAVVVGITCIALLSQAVRTAPSRNWTNNVNSAVIGSTYLLIFLFSIAFCLNRRVTRRRKLASIPKSHVAVRKGEIPYPAQSFIEEEFLRTCLVTYESLPKDVRREGWGTPGTHNEGIRFRRALLDTVPKIDEMARLVIPSMPPLRPNVPMAFHLRHIRTLVSADKSGELYFRTYTSMIQAARYNEREPTEEEYEAALTSFNAIQRILLHYRIVQIDEEQLIARRRSKSPQAASSGKTL